jgi:hypothetical protein
MPTSMTFASLTQDLQNYLERGTVLDPIVFAQLPELINFAERRISRELKVLGFVVSANFSLQSGLAVYAKPDRWREMISLNVGNPGVNPVSYPITSVAAATPGFATYNGTFPGAGSNALAGQLLAVTGCTSPSNNGTFTVASSQTTSVVLANAAAVYESEPAAAIATGTSIISSVSTYQRQQVFPRSYEYLRAYWPNDAATSFSTYGVYGTPKFYAEYNYQNLILAPTPDLNYPAEIMYYEEPALLDATNTTNWITQYAPNLLLYSALIECSPFLKNDARIATWQSLYDRAAAVLNSESNAGVLDRNSTREET